MQVRVPSARISGMIVIRRMRGLVRGIDALGGTQDGTEV